MLAGKLFDLVEIDAPIIAAHAVSNRVEPLPGQVRPRTVGQMAAGGKRHAEDRVAWVEQRDKDRLVGLRPGVRLYVGKTAIEQPLGPFDRQALDDIDELAAAIVAAARIAL